MKKVVQISDSASREGGGIFESLQGFTRSLKATGRWWPLVVAECDACWEADAAAWGGISVNVVARCRVDPLGMGVSLHAAVEAQSPDVLHLHGIWGAASRAAWWLRRHEARCPLVISPHGMLEPWALNNSRWKKKLAWAAWNGSLVRRAQCLHALCEEEARSLAELVPGVPICIISNGVDVPVLVPAPKVHSARKSLLFVGRIHPKKGLYPLIEAWARAPAMAADGWHLIIAGWDDGGHLAALQRRVAELRLESCVTFAGPVTGAAKEALFHSASAFALPSFSEGLPMAVLEAWSHGLPVLMTDECHLGAGFTAGAARRVEPTAASIADGLSDFAARARRGELASMGARGRALVDERFSWARVGDDMAAVYDWLMGGLRPVCIVN